MHLVRTSEQTATFLLHGTNRLVLYNWKWVVFPVQYALEFLYKADNISLLKG